MTNNKKVKSIKLNTEKDVMFFDYIGESYKANGIYEVYPSDANLHIHAYLYDRTVSPSLARYKELTDYGLSELEKGNIIVEWEEELRKTEGNNEEYFDMLNKMPEKFGESEFVKKLPHPEDTPIIAEFRLHLIQVMMKFDKLIDYLHSKDKHNNDKEI